MRPGRTRGGSARSALLLLGVACAGRSVGPLAVVSPAVVEEPVTAILNAAIEADLHLSAADSLWDPEATVVANGTLRYAPPHFAGVDPGGEVAITSSRLEVRQNVVWVFLEYRWLSLRDGLAREGKATVLLTLRPDRRAWRIVHLHSSTSR